MFEKLRKTIRNTTASPPVECPRGWGPVTFQLSGMLVLPFAIAGRKCPISGTETCATCTYASNPDSLRLGENLAELERLQQAGLLSKDEHAQRRSALLVLHAPGDPRIGYRTTAWILGPLGTLAMGAGLLIDLEEPVFFWLLTTIGGVLLALTISFAALGRRPSRDTLDLTADLGSDLRADPRAHAPRLDR